MDPDEGAAGVVVAQTPPECRRARREMLALFKTERVEMCLGL